MAHIYISRCDCCGLEIGNMQVEVCPRCYYPVQPDKEERFLETALHDLRRVMRYGGSAITVTDLAHRYEGRLQFLLGLKSRTFAPPMNVPVQPPAPAITPHIPSFDDSTISAGSRSAVTQSGASSFPTFSPPVAAQPGAPRQSVPFQPAGAQPGIPGPRATRASGFTLSGNAVANILAALGGFLVLAGALSIGLINGPWLSFVAVFLVHAAFGAAGLITRRVPLLRAVSHLYIIIFALLIPLVGFSAYRLVAGSLVELSAPALLTLAALYAAVIYILLAVMQRFVPFAYLGAVALLIGDLALARTLNLAYWWWPCMAMLLALVALLALPRVSGGTQPLNQTWAILHVPLQVFMYAVVSAACLLLPFLLAYSQLLDSLAHHPVEELHLALLALACLLFTWFALSTWRTRRLRRVPLLAYLFLVPILLLGYTLNLELAGYILLLAGTALFYHALGRVAGLGLAAYGLSDLVLDQLAIGLSVLVLLLAAFATPFQLAYRAYAGSSVQNIFLSISNPFTFPSVQGSSLPFGILALGVCLLVTLDITVRRSGFGRAPARAGWCWLLTLCGLLLAAVYGLGVLAWQVHPLWAFLALSLALLTCAVLVRRFAGATWANPLDVLSLGSIVFALVLSLGQAQDVVGVLLLGFAALLYGVLLYQHRPLPTMFSSLLLLLAVPFLSNHPLLLLNLSLLLPLLVAGMRLEGLFGNNIIAGRNVFSWTLLVPAFFYGLVLTGMDINSGQSVFASWSGLHVVGAYEIAVLGIAWYAAALLARVKLWLVPAALFWLIALLLPTNDFWVLVVLTPGLGVVAAYIDRHVSYAWALPFCLAALCGVGVVGFTGLAHQQVAAMVWVMLGFALLAYFLGLFTNRQLVFWLTPLLATWAVFVAAARLGNLYLPPLVVIVGAGLGVVASRSTLLTPLAAHRRATALYALPLYVTALVAAVLTGVYGEVGDLNRPFYGALPSALLVYALVTWAVLVIERWQSWGALVAVFACWGMLLARQLAPSYILGAGIDVALLGLLCGRLFQPAQQARGAVLSRIPASLTRNWPWYVAFVVAVFVLGSWPSAPGHVFTPGMIAPEMLAFTVLAAVVMLIERVPEFLIFPAGMAAWTISLWVPVSQPTLSILAYTLLCVLLFATQVVWRYLPAATHWLPETSLHNGLALGGLCVVLLDACKQGALSVDAGNLAHAGVLALVTLSVLLVLYGLLHSISVARSLPQDLSELQRGKRLAMARSLLHWCCYIAGFLLSLAVSWELLAFRQTRFDVLSLVPASYLIVVAPFLLRDQALPERHFVGQAASLAGAALLLLPSLWLSFNGSDLLPTLILLSEALLLFALGLIIRLRVFILSSAALIVVGTLRVLFLSIPPSVPILLMIFGSLLVLLATALILSRHRLQAAWNRWE